MTIDTSASTPPAPLPPVPYQPTSPPSFPPASYRTSGTPRNRRWWIAVIAAVAVVGVIAIGAIVSGGGKSTAPAAPTRLRVVSTTATTVTIAWAAGAATSPSLFHVYRNGIQIESVYGFTHRFTDVGLKPATAYRYQVSAHVSGRWSARSATLIVTTKHGSLAAAPLATTSQYSVRLKIVSEYGYTHLSAGNSSTQTWWFNGRPGTSKYTLLGNVASGSFKMPIRQTGQRFAGKTHETLSQCSYLPVNTAVELTFRTTRAATVDGTWTVTTFTGTLHQVAPSKTVGLSTCPGAGYTATVIGRVVR